MAVEDGKDAMICAFPDHRIHGDDGGGEQRGTPVGRQVDDPRRQAGVEQHVAGEVPVNQLVTPLHRPELRGELVDRRHQREPLEDAGVPSGPVGRGKEVSTPPVP